MSTISSPNQGNQEAAECGKALKRFFEEIGHFRAEIEYMTGFPLPDSYREALDKVKTILDDMIRDCQDHITPPVDPRAAPILKYERDVLDNIRDKIRSVGRWDLPKWLKKGFKRADIIIDSLEKNFPGLSFVGEFKKQVDNFVPA